METNQKTVNASKKAPASKKAYEFKGIRMAWLVLVISYVVAMVIFHGVFGAGSHFTGGDNNNNPIDLMGSIYKGGFIVPIIWTLFLTVAVLTIERLIALMTASGKGSLVKFVEATRKALDNKDLDGVKKLCDKQGGVVANVVGATLQKYKEVESDSSLTKEQQVLGIQKALDEATALEMPSLQQNLPVIATIVTLGVLTGLLGTVIGMIKSFSALSAGGGADSAELSRGISEALVNTASGIATSALAVIAYNYFTARIDKLTYSLDEVGFTLVQNFSATH
jgi:biopolymer transport protein ExbB